MLQMPYLEETQPLLAQVLCAAIFALQLFLLGRPLKTAHQWTIQTLLVVLAANISSIGALMNLLVSLIFCFVMLSAWIQSSVACVLFTAYVVTPRYASIVPQLWKRALDKGLLSMALWQQHFAWAAAWLLLAACAFYVLKKSFHKRAPQNATEESQQLLLITLSALGFFYVPAIAPLALALALSGMKKPLKLAL